MWEVHVQNNRPNSKTGDKTPKELLFREKTFYKKLRIFGEKAFLHVPKEKRQKPDDHTVKGRVVMFCPNNKGWLFSIPATNSLTSSVWADFPNIADGVRTIQQWTIKNPCEKGCKHKKGDINFILNNLTLGEFKHKDKVRSQDSLTDQLSMTTARIPVPKT
ncbi:hypothetical protein O181_059705 [Austropuccinia psidii MF-1]|uniref:Retroviral polymerase SH3-like domain-containing protein n=1 Tax=Austropuccinia psidii MF-1 TaxID=1389203 RepID=A0A9Q3EBZ0_9BASI|nr:hypothetical protein [Austropuccinia psidii MF-1]